MEEKKQKLKKDKGGLKLREERDEYKQGWQRALADYNNLQKEIEQKKSEWIKLSEASILEDFIPVYENFKKAFAAENGCENPKCRSWKEGVGYIMKQFLEILRSYGVEEIKTVGEKFDPSLHEAVGEEESEAEEGTILRELGGGYKMGDKVIIFAKVIIAK